MDNSEDYTFILDSKTNTRYVVGKYNYDTKTPCYEIELSVPQHVKNYVEVKHVLIGSPENCNWGWDISNESSWPVIVKVKKDGVLIKKS